MMDSCFRATLFYLVAVQEGFSAFRGRVLVFMGRREGFTLPLPDAWIATMGNLCRINSEQNAEFV